MPPSLTERIKAEFDARDQRLKTAEQEKVKESQSREQGLANFAKACDDLKSVWRPRLEEFSKQFGEEVKVTPTTSPSLREVKMRFPTELANATLTLSVAPSPDAATLVLSPCGYR